MPLDLPFPELLAGKPDVVYCIPLPIRDEQIKAACARPLPRIQPHADDGRPERVAIVGFGPSLNDTWEQLRDFPVIFSCSGSHKFLVERGIIPTYHVEVDPRPHKVTLIGPPQASTQYLIASACHAEVFEHLKDNQVTLWHVFDASDSGQRVLPRGEWAITGGCDVGLRAVTIAAFLGFRDLHVFGLDGCARDKNKHAAAHPNAVKKYVPCTFDGVTYDTTPGLLKAAVQLWHELDCLPKRVQTTFYGEGLIQHMAKHYRPKREEHAFVAMTRPETISAEYRALNQQLHRDNVAYGVGGGKHAPHIIKIVQKSNGTISTILDYGCGKGYLAKELPFPIWEYDPAIPEKAESPRPADLVVCTDVLEHIEPEKLNVVLDDLRRCTKRVGWFVVHTRAASKLLADGRNAHLIQRGRRWWEKKLRKYFTLAAVKEVDPEVYFVVTPAKAA